jgi:chemotaxis protein histidine kinase CheA
LKFKPESDTLTRLAREATGHTLCPERLPQWGLIVRFERGQLVVPVTAIAGIQPYDRLCIASTGGLTLGRHAGRTFAVMGIEGVLAGRRATPFLEDTDRSRHSVLILEHDQQWAGLLVTELGNRFEFTMKPFGKFMRGIPGLSGTTVLPDGTVGFVLSPEEAVTRVAESIHD